MHKKYRYLRHIFHERCLMYLINHWHMLHESSRSFILLMLISEEIPRVWKKKFNVRVITDSSVRFGKLKLFWQSKFRQRFSKAIAMNSQETVYNVAFSMKVLTHTNTLSYWITPIYKALLTVHWNGFVPECNFIWT